MKAAEHNPEGIRIRLPATSANLGPGFDAVGVALSLSLQIEAHAARHDSVTATGRDAEFCGRVERNLILESYRSTAEAAKVQVPPLKLEVDNEIPLGMGCGSSAAARLAGVMLANHFGHLGFGDAETVAAASRMEGHPDNVAACWHGGFTISVPHEGGVAVATIPCDGTWQLLLALPQAQVATEKARGVLPDSYRRADAVFNVQRVALLTAAFAQQRLDLLQVAMKDRLHQPFRREICPLLENLDRLQHCQEFAGIALSGAGPALLAVVDDVATLREAESRLISILGENLELFPVRIAGGAAAERLEMSPRA